MIKCQAFSYKPQPHRQIGKYSTHL